jgi:hypothetical protein
VKNHRANEFVGGSALADGLNFNELLRSTFTVTPSFPYLPGDPDPATGWFLGQAPAPGEKYQCYNQPGPDWFNIIDDQQVLCDYVNNLLALVGTNDRFFYIRAYHLIHYLRLKTPYSLMPVCVQNLLNHPLLCGLQDLVDIQLGLEQSFENVDSTNYRTLADVQQSYASYSSSRNTLNRSELSTKLSSWNTDFNSIYASRQAHLINSQNTLNNLACTDSTFVMWKDAMSLNISFLRGQTYTSSEQAHISSQAQLCADAYGDPIHWLRALKTDFDFQRSVNRDDCLSGAAPRSKVSFNAQLEVLPNPNSGVFDVSIPQIEVNSQLRIFDLNGRLVYKKELIPGIEKVSIDLTGQAEGLYTVVIDDNTEKLFSRNFVITK